LFETATTIAINFLVLRSVSEFQIPTAYRKSLAGKLEFTGPLFWNVRRV